jgi:hypothetical protein
MHACRNRQVPEAAGGRRLHSADADCRNAEVHFSELYRKAGLCAEAIGIFALGVKAPALRARARRPGMQKGGGGRGPAAA